MGYMPAYMHEANEQIAPTDMTYVAHFRFTYSNACGISVSVKIR